MYCLVNSKTVSETTKAIQQLSSDKAPGSDTVPAEFYEADGPPMAEKLKSCFTASGERKQVPKEFNDASIIHLYKRTGKPQVCTCQLWEDAGKTPAETLGPAGLLTERKASVDSERNDLYIKA